MKRMVLRMMLMFMLVIALTACGGRKDTIIGTWSAYAFEIEGKTYTLEDLSALLEESLKGLTGDIKLEFLDEGVLTVHGLEDGDKTGTWLKDGSSYTLTINAEGQPAVIQDNMLKVTVDGESIMFTKDN